MKEIKAFGSMKMTPIIMSAYINSFDIFMFLFFELGCSLDATCSKGNNALHYAVINKNEALVKKLVYLDADFGILRRKDNKEGKVAADLADDDYKQMLITIWDVVRQGNLQKIKEIVQQP